MWKFWKFRECQKENGKWWVGRRTGVIQEERISRFWSGRDAFSQKSEQTKWKSQSHPHSACVAADSTGCSAVQQHEMVLCHNFWAILTNAFHAMQWRKQSNFIWPISLRSGQRSALYKHFRASAIHFLLCTNKPLFFVKFWTQKVKLARPSPLVERLLSAATQKKVFYKQNCKVI